MLDRIWRELTGGVNDIVLLEAEADKECCVLIGR